MGYRYIGAKTKSLGKILEKITSLISPDGYVVDLMCGTAAIAAPLRNSGFRVTAADIMTFSYHHARVALFFTTFPEFHGARNFIMEYSETSQRSLVPLTPYESILMALNSVPPQEGYFWREFSNEGCPKNIEKPRNYFSPENAKQIDAIRAWIRRLKEQEQITDLEHSLLLHDLIMATNDIANIAGTYGHYLAKLMGRAKSPIVLKSSTINIREDGGRHNVLKGYAEELAGHISCDLCYIDPPYMKRQYAANYHILETIAREDEPEAIGVSGLRPWRDQYSNFCTKTKIANSFKKIFQDMKCQDFLISYSEDGLLSLEELMDLFSPFGQVQLTTFKYKRFKSNNSRLSPELTEYLFHLKISR